MDMGQPSFVPYRPNTASLNASYRQRRDMKGGRKTDWTSKMLNQGNMEAEYLRSDESKTDSKRSNLARVMGG